MVDVGRVCTKLLGRYRLWLVSRMDRLLRFFFVVLVVRIRFGSYLIRGDVLNLGWERSYKGVLDTSKWNMDVAVRTEEVVANYEENSIED
jgi:hypothetical protein